MNCLVNFENLPWEHITTGMRLKTFKESNQQIQMIELSEGFFEQDWCLHSHTNYIIDGEFATDFDGEKVRYKKGDCIFIPKAQNIKQF